MPVPRRSRAADRSSASSSRSSCRPRSRHGSRRRRRAAVDWRPASQRTGSARPRALPALRELPRGRLPVGPGRDAARRASSDGVRVVVGAGPTPSCIFVDCRRAAADRGDRRRAPRLVDDDLARHRAIGFVLARSADGPLCIWRGKRYRLTEDEPGPFAGREDLALVLAGIRDLMAMPSAGDLVIYGNDVARGQRLVHPGARRPRGAGRRGDAHVHPVPAGRAPAGRRSRIPSSSTRTSSRTRRSRRSA